MQFRHVPGNLYRNRLGIDLDKSTNELVIRIQVRGLLVSCVRFQVARGNADSAGTRTDGNELVIRIQVRIPDVGHACGVDVRVHVACADGKKCWVCD